MHRVIRDYIRSDTIAQDNIKFDNMFMVNQSLSKSATVPPEAVAAGFATPVEAARFLRLSKAMVHKLIGEGTVPACRFGRAVRIPWSWLQAQTGHEGASRTRGGEPI
jgi:excisionase family DNA binding protein